MIDQGRPCGLCGVLRALILVWLALSLAVLLGACSPARLAKAGARAALGGGPSVAANVQAGKTNTQAFQAQVTDQRLVRPQARTIEQSAGETGVRAEAVQSVTVRNDAPVWVWLLVVVAVGVAAGALVDDLRRRFRRG